jgi:hypothetical protein
MQLIQQPQQTSKMLHRPTIYQQMSYYGCLLISIIMCIIDFVFSFTDKSCAIQDVPISLQTYLLITAILENSWFWIVLLYGRNFCQLELITTSINPYVLFNIYFADLAVRNNTAGTWLYIIAICIDIWRAFIGSFTFWKWTNTNECNTDIYVYIICSLCLNYVSWLYCIYEVVLAHFQKVNRDSDKNRDGDNLIV